LQIKKESALKYAYTPFFHQLFGLIFAAQAMTWAALIHINKRLHLPTSVDLYAMK